VYLNGHHLDTGITSGSSRISHPAKRQNDLEESVSETFNFRLSGSELQDSWTLSSPCRNISLDFCGARNRQ